jgi:hypothetical protein
MIKFQKFAVVNAATKAKARVSYSLDNRTDGRKCVTIYAKDYGHALYSVLPSDYKNETEIMTDYFDKGKAVLFEGHPLYETARLSVEAMRAA